jgi:hypothetical protein
MLLVFDWIGIARLLFRCAKTVSELLLFEVLGLLFERKQIPQIVVIVRISRKTMDPLEATRLPTRQVLTLAVTSAFGHPLGF